jgi:hypothetical protein
MKYSVLVILLICLVLTGCVVPSLNPLYTDKDLIVLPGLDGTWIDNENVFGNLKNAMSILIGYPMPKIQNR